MNLEHARTVGLDTSALDPSFKEHAQRGIGRYVSNLVQYFSKNPMQHGLSVVPFNHRSVRSCGPRLIQAANSLIDWLPAGRTTARQQVVFPLQLRYAGAEFTSRQPLKRFDVIHFPAHMDAPAWGLKGYILTVLDLIPLVCADLYRAQHFSWRFRFARWLEIQAIKNARLILAISKNTARDVERILGVAPERIMVTPLGVNEEFFATEKLGADERRELLSRIGLPDERQHERPLILYVGGIDPRKNYKGALRVFRDVVNDHITRAKQAPLLLMIGNIAKDKEYPKLLELIKELRLNDDVVCTGYVADDDLIKLYRIASVFLFMSLYEGFGLPPLEAMAAGLPVVSSNTSAMPEVLGDSALLVDPHEERQAARAVLEILSRSELAQSLRERGRLQAQRFTWGETGKRTEQGYERACGSF